MIITILIDSNLNIRGRLAGSFCYALPARCRCLRLQCFPGKNLPLKAFKLRTISAPRSPITGPAKAPLSHFVKVNP